MIRMSKPDTRRRSSVVDDPPIYLATLAALVGRDPNFLQGERVSAPVEPDLAGDQAQQWTALDRREAA